VLERIVETTRIFEAWSDEKWVNEGAAVRVSLLGFGPMFSVDRNSRLDGVEVASIHADLTAAVGVDLTKAKLLPENANTAYLGIQKTGPFDLPGEIGRSWLGKPNPNGRPNSEIVKPWSNGLDITRRPRDMWIVDFGTDMPEVEASLYELPFTHVRKHVQPTRVGKREARTNEMWWLFQWSRPVMRKAIKNLPRFIVTPEVAKHRVFAFLTPPTVADKNLTVIARSDDTSFGILHSRFHELWSLRLCTWLGVGNDPRYTPTTCFETFPFPPGLTPRDTAPVAGQTSPPSLAGHVAENIASAARRLNQLREAWLNPPEWVDWVITPEEEKAGFPKRAIAKPGHEADLKKRTLTNLYNAPPAWLTLAHQQLDAAVAAAYGWKDYTPEMSDDEILRRLLALNLERAAAK
jgi:type II restriction/modification system DNA methylase subunit YeeA